MGYMVSGLVLLLIGLPMIFINARTKNILDWLPFALVGTVLFIIGFTLLIGSILSLKRAQ